MGMPRAVIQIPRKVLTDVMEAGQRFRDAEDTLEDFLFSTNAAFVRKMRRLRVLHRRGRLGSWEKLKAKYGL